MKIEAKLLPNNDLRLKLLIEIPEIDKIASYRVILYTKYSIITEKFIELLSKDTKYRLLDKSETLAYGLLTDRPIFAEKDKLCAAKKGILLNVELWMSMSYLSTDWIEDLLYKGNTLLIPAG